MEEVKAYFEKKLGVQLKSDTRFFTDLGIDGYDACLLMKEFGEHYNIDMSEFDYSMYFCDEQGLLNFPKRIIGFWFKGKESYHFNLAHCENVIKRKKWFDMNTKD